MDIDIITARIKAYKAGDISHTIFINTIYRAINEEFNWKRLKALHNLLLSTKRLNNKFRGKPY